MPFLIMSKNSTGYHVFNFLDTIRIGREENNDIVLNDKNDTAISRHHAHIDEKDGTYILVDQSSNGTTVNGELIKEYRLSHGESFQVIDYLFTFVDDAATEQIKQKTADNGIDFEDTATTIIQRPETKRDDRADVRELLLKDGIIIENEKMISLYQDVYAVAGINIPVLITGEPGTGKEKVASALHTFSKAKGEFVPLNCSSIPEGIFESELFGCVKGAFHNATDKPGKLELADNGTIFFDEVGDMILPLQPKLLRFLEDKQLTRLGDTRIKNINTRVVAATNQDLKAMIAEKKFRSDFYQRLACVRLEIPPLRERPEDILPLAEYFLSRFSKEHGLKVSRISQDAQHVLLDYHWPGNIRELGNSLLSAAVRNRGKIITPECLFSASEELKENKKYFVNEFLSIKDMERIHITEALERTGWNKVDAAKLLGMSRDTLYKKIQKYKISQNG